MSAPLARGQASSRIESALQGVDGWLGLDEAWALYEGARTVRPDRPPVIVEIGAYMGRSAISLALGAKDSRSGGGRVISIDPGDMETDQYESFLANIRRAGVDDIVEPIRELSHAARPQIQDRTVDLLFVDGSHEYEDVLTDIDDWTSALTEGAIVAFNDPFWPGVAKALRERVGCPGSPFRHPAFVPQTVFVRFMPGRTWRTSDSFRAWRLRVFVDLGRRWRNFHWRLVVRKRIPAWVKRSQLRAAVVFFSLVLPRHRP